MSERRFTEKYELAPWAVRGLDEDHPAMRENRTLFPSTVLVAEEEGPPLLISGFDNRKIGKTVEKGKFKGYGIFCLTLEERATCPASCEVRDICYGNGMQMARRNKIGEPDIFFDRLAFEIAEHLDEHEGLLIRLHVLGDFPSVEYVAFWKEVLDEYPNVACFGYTHRSTTSWGGDDIGDAIQSVKDAHPERFRIRWSSPVARPDGAVVINSAPEGPRAADNELVCPSQRDATACCATCALCWDASFARETIAFIKHGPKSDEANLAEIVKADTGNHRPIAPILIRGLTPANVQASDIPTYELVQPSDLTVEPSYQRDLSTKSLSLIRKIVNEWDWAKFKPPVCARDGDNLFVIDGQHTAIAAATHPHIYRIPVMVVDRSAESRRADAFVSQNMDRVIMSPLQVFHAKVVAGNKAYAEIFKEALIAGLEIPKSAPLKGKAKAGQVASINALVAEHSGLKKPQFQNLLQAIAATKFAPVNSTIIRSMAIVLKRGEASPAAKINDWTTIGEMTSCYEIAEFETEALKKSVEQGIGKYHAGAAIIEEMCNAYLET